MSGLNEFIKVRSAHSRSTNVELDRSQDSLQRYIPTGRSLEVISRISESLKLKQVCRSFSIIGPYGSGKSSFAVFLGALLQGQIDEGSKLAWKTLKRTSSTTSAELQNIIRPLLKNDQAFLLGTATAQREPIDKTIQRCIHAALKGQRKGSILSPKSELALSKDKCSGKDLLIAIQEIIKHRPLLIAVDEFGKNLESFTDAPNESDLFILQQVAELAQTETAHPLILLTLQHLSFNEYVTGISHSGRRELSKIQGRFEEIPYNDSPEQYRRLVAEVFFDRKPKLVKQIDNWFAGWGSKFVKLDFDSLFNDVATKESFPLHPISLLCLPELCNRFGQNERTLFSFLTSNEPLSVRSYVESTAWSPNQNLPFVRLDHIYDYFIRSASNTVGSAELASRLIEIETRVRDSQGLGAYRESVLKSIGVLNLVASGGTARSSGDTLALAMHDCLFDDEAAADLREALLELEEKGLITYREFADEYRIWNGTDFGLRQRLQEARREAKLTPLDQMLQAAIELSPLVANRHSQEKGILRVFSRTFSGGRIDESFVPTDRSVFDGAIIYWTTSDEPSIKFLSQTNKPLLIATANIKALGEVAAAAIEAFAVEKVTKDAISESADWVARKELAERNSHCRQRLLALIETAWSTSDSTWKVINPRNAVLSKKFSVLRNLSTVCDQIYAKSPIVKNETISRRVLTAQGARARRILAELVIKQSDKKSFAIEGHGPEKSIYDAIFELTGLHRFDNKSKNWIFDFSFPKDESWSGVRDQINGFLDGAKTNRTGIQDLADRLQAPPIGLKEGLINLLLITLLYSRATTLLLYEHGSLIVELDDAIVERLLRNPGHFAVKNLGIENAKLGTAIENIARSLQVMSASGSPTLLDVARKLYRDVHTLPAYSLNIESKLSSEAVEVRRVIKSATELDVLIYEALPAALKFESFKDPNNPLVQKHVQQFAEKLASALKDLKDSYPNLLVEIRERIATELSALMGSNTDLRATLVVEAAQLREMVLDKKLKAFVGAILRENLSESEWTENLAMIIADGQPPRSWREETLTQFGFSLKEICGTFYRLKILLFEHAEPKNSDVTMFRVTVTHQDGSEFPRTVSASRAESDALRHIMSDAIAKAALTLGDKDRAADVMMAILSDRDKKSSVQVAVDREEANG